jgi:hypothetical protein
MNIERLLKPDKVRNALKHVLYKHNILLRRLSIINPLKPKREKWEG